MPAGRRGGGPVPATWHGCQHPPIVLFWIVAFILGESIRRKLAAQHQDQALIERIGEPTSGGRKPWSRRPRICRRLVNVVHVRWFVGRAKAAADGMEFPF